MSRTLLRRAPALVLTGTLVPFLTLALSMSPAPFVTRGVFSASRRPGFPLSAWFFLRFARAFLLLLTRTFPWVLLGDCPCLEVFSNDGRGYGAFFVCALTIVSVSDTPSSFSLG